MKNRWVLVSLAVGIGTVAPTALSAQGSRSQFPDPQIYDPKTYSEELTPGQIQRAQEPDSQPDRSAPPPSKAQPKQPAAPPRAVACGGAFGKDSSHLKLATVYKSENVAFTEVDAPEGKKLMASVLFPKDPKRRLEVWWQNEASRTGTYLIVINGQSTWSAPKGVKIGLQLAALERLNGKPFKLKGFDKDNIGSVSDWQGGALASLTGGCKVGAFLRPDAKSAPEARNALSATAEYTSADASVKAVRPTVAEIIIGY
jgi:hypothetical protein